VTFGVLNIPLREGERVTSLGLSPKFYHFLVVPSGALWENVEALKTIGQVLSPEEKPEEPKRLEAGIFVMVRGSKTLVASYHCLFVESFAVWKVVVHSKGKYFKFNISFDV